MQARPSDKRLEPRPTQANYALLRRLRRQFEQAIELHVRGDGHLVDVLDVGCGEKPYRSLFDGVAQRYVGMDVAEGPHVDVVGSAEALPFEDASFDVVLCSQVLEHVEHPQRVIAEARRLLRPGGVMLLSTHGVVRWHGAYDGPLDDYRRWTHSGLSLEFRQAADWARVDVVPNTGTAGALAFLLGREVEAVAQAAGRRRAAHPAVFVLNALAWRLDGFQRHVLRGRPPELVANYVVVARC